MTSVINLTEILKKHQLYGSKNLDFLDFCIGVNIIKKKEYLTEEGKNKIKDLHNGMNLRRKNF